MKKNYLLALLSAMMLWLGWPPIPYTAPLLLIAFVPLLIAIEQVLSNPSPKKGKQVFLLAGCTGLVWNTASIYWVYNAISSGLPAYAALLISFIPFSLAALLMSLTFRCYYQLRKRYSAKISLIGLTCLWISYEYLHQSWDLAFPWMTLGNGFANSHSLIQWYSYTGVYGGTLWIWSCNVALFLIIRKKRWQHIAPSFSAYFPVGGLVILPMAISLIQYMNYEERENPSNVVVVQPNVDPYQKFGSLSVSDQLDQLLQLSKSVAQPNTEFFIWPETAIPERPPGINEEQIRTHPAYLKIRNFLSDYRNGNVLSGIESNLIYNSPQSPSAHQFSEQLYFDVFNAAILIDNSSRVQFYHKSKLVPGVEQMPFSRALSFLKPLFSAFGGSTGGYGRQDKPSVFYAQSGIGTAPVICYESIWGAYVAEYVKQGAQFIAVITNDGWWGDTSGKDQHLAYARLRAIENRRWVARSANTGISAFINQRGDLVQKTTWWKPTAIKADINLNEEITFYTATGDYIAYLGCAGGLIFLLLAMTGKPFLKKKKAKS